MIGRRLFPMVLLVLALCGVFAFAQDVLTVDEAAMNQHVDHRVAPVYPPIAKAAHIQGTVIFSIRVDAKGSIESMKVLSGPAMLQQAAIDCLKQWTFRPFARDGVAKAAEGSISIPFALSNYHPPANDEEIADRYFPLFDQCTKTLSNHQDYSAAESACNQAAETAEQFGQEVRFIEKRSAYVYAASACADNQDFPRALTWAKKAVAVVQLGHDDDSGMNAAYSMLGTIEGLTGDLDGADRDLTVAENDERNGISRMEKDAPSISKNYMHVLAQDLRFHAKVLNALGRGADAQKKLDEATNYE